MEYKVLTKEDRRWTGKFSPESLERTLNEVGHHGTQIGALRDLYAWRNIDRRRHGDLRGSRA